MKISDRGFNFIKEREGYSSVPYKDVVGKNTIGFGHLIKQGEVFGALSSVEATALLRKDITQYEDCVNSLVTVPLTQNQFDALVSFCYNLGCTNLKNSTLLKMLNAGLYEDAARQFLRWDRAEGKEVRGLLVRRGQEMGMFLEK